MKCARFVALSAAALAAPLAYGAKVTPVAKVIDMLNGMLASGKDDMASEQQVFAEYSKWVQTRSTELGFEIKTSQSSIEDLKALIEKLDNEVAQLGEHVQGLDNEIATLDSEKKAATAIRKSEREEFLKLQQDYSESVDALERAIDTVSAQNYDRPQAMMLLQGMASTSFGMRRVLAAMDNEAEDTGAPAADAYSSQTGGIVAMLQGLLKKFKQELDEVETAESNRAHYFNLANLHLTNSIEHATSSREEKAATKAKTAAESANAKGQLADTVKALKEQKQFLSDIQATFKGKSATFAANQKVRADELAAIAKAVEIISSPSVAGSYAEHINLAQVRVQGRALIQLGSSLRSSVRTEAAKQLQERAAALGSEALAQLAKDLASSPFGKVIQMIESLLTKLKEEAAAEADHKAWCDTELASNKLKREKQTTTVQKLTAEIEQATSQIQTFARQIETLSKEQADLTTAVREATEQRQKEKAENTKTIADAQAGSSAVKQALVVLREFYASQSSLLQKGQQTPEMKEYKGQGGRSGGVIGMLEVIASDFLRLETDTKAAEDRAASEYARFTADAEADKLAKHNTEVRLRLKKDQREFERSLIEKDLAGNQQELDKANEYFEYLKPNCLEVKVSYEDRVARREEEIEALKQAYNTLNSK